MSCLGEDCGLITIVICLITDNRGLEIRDQQRGGAVSDPTLSILPNGIVHRSYEVLDSEFVTYRMRL